MSNLPMVEVRHILMVEALRRIGDNRASGHGHQDARTVLSAVIKDWTALDDGFAAIYAITMKELDKPKDVAQ